MSATMTAAAPAYESFAFVASDHRIRKFGRQPQHRFLGRFHSKWEAITQARLLHKFLAAEYGWQGVVATAVKDPHEPEHMVAWVRWGGGQELDETEAATAKFYALSHKALTATVKAAAPTS
jgi:hypothetical protein